MNTKNKIILTLVILVVLSFSAYLVLNFLGKTPSKNPPISTITFDPQNATYVIENVAVTLINGKAESNNQNTKTTTKIFGDPTIGDLNGDAKNDAAIMITQDMGGSGTFYYVAAAINTNSGARGTNAVFLGDRIAPQNIEIKNSQIIANYADRNPGQAMSTEPSLAVSTYLSLDGLVLKKSVASTQLVTYLISKEATTKYCNGADMNSAGYQKTITEEKSTSTSEINPTKVRIIKTVLNAATTGMCKSVMNQLDITENNGTVTIPPIDAWAGVSIVMCSCKPQVETNLLQIPGITKVIWSSIATSSNATSTSTKSDQIKVESPLPNQVVTSPLTIKGQARGTWFFEASFPVVLVDWDGKIIAQGTASTKSNWMTSKFVPFVATLSFKVAQNVYSSKGALILRKDNPSGLATNKDSLEIPVIIGTTAPVKACTQEAKLCSDGSYVGRTGPNCEFTPCP